MSHSTNTLALRQPKRVMASLYTIIRDMRKLSTRLSPLPISELLQQLEKTTSPAQLTKTVNQIQSTLWKLPAQEQTALRKHLISALTMHLLQSTEETVRLEAGSWLRLLLQAGLVTEPQTIFVTLVTATMQAQHINDALVLPEQRAYLKMIFECFWPFRYPYPAFTWQQFPANEVFYPLASMLSSADYATQDTLISIFSELPTLDDAEIQQYLLPIALQWSNHADAERRRRVTNALARMNCDSAQEALYHLLSDADPVVRDSAQSATGYVRQA